ncbi:MAG: glycosyl hydrolase family 95 catalytic domain-containing protein [Candidatus Fimenecus sp.]
MKHTVTITAPPARSGKYAIPDGALCGNGDMSAILGNSGTGLRVYLAKCDLWMANEHRDENGGIKPLGYVDFDVPKALYKNYYVEQRMDESELFCRFADSEKFVEITVFVCATQNDVFFTLSASDDSLLPTPRFSAFSCGADTLDEFSKDGICGFTRAFDNEKLQFPCFVTAGLRAFSKNQYVLSAATNFDSDTYTEDVLSHLGEFDENTYKAEKAAHTAWWKAFYAKSAFEVADEQLELNWYACQYHLAICARNEKFPPGIYGNFITVENVNWHGDYHLNYNYEAPFYALCNSNHTELTDCYFTPLLEFLPRGKQCAKAYLNCNGVYYPVGMLPKGLFSEYSEPPAPYEKMFLGQKSNAAYAAVIAVMRWNATRDTAYAAEHLYPFLKEVGAFWEDFLVYEGGRYVIHDDAIHEVPYYVDNFNPRTHQKEIHAKNNLLSLGLVRMVFGALLDMAKALGQDAEKYEKWQDILEKLSDYPTFRKRLKKVFRYTEKGMSWNNGNFLCLQHIYPVGQWGRQGKEELLQIARNTFFINDRWCDDNATNSIFPCAVRLGISPKLILEKLKLNYKKFQQPNLLMLHGGGCLENCCLTAATLNEMVLQSYEGVLRIFPNWDKDLDCRFENLRADGAFLVSAQIENGEITDIEIVSEQGGTLVLENPFEACKISADSEQVFTQREIKMDMQENQRITVTKA